MVKQPLYLSMKEPKNRTLYAKKGDTGRVYDIYLTDGEEENGTLRILRPDGVEVTSDARKDEEVIPTDGVASFDSLEEAEVTELKIALSPKQDLHGYANPWVGGGGKNLCFLTDPELTVNVSQTLAGPNVLPSGTYTLTVSFDLVNATFSSGNAAIFNLTANGSNNYRTPTQCYRISDNKSMNQLTPPYTDRFWFRFTDIVNPSSLITYFMSNSYGLWTGTMKNVQLELGTTPTDFAPYSNICPIYPSNGKNLLQLGGRTIVTNDNYTNTSPRDFSVPKAYIGISPNNYFSNATVNDYSIADNKIVVNSGNLAYGVGLTVNCRPSTQYCVSFSDKEINQIGIGFFDASGNFISFWAVDNNYNWKFETPSNCTNLMVVFRPSTLNAEYTYNCPQLELGERETEYIPFQAIAIHQVGKNLFTYPSYKKVSQSPLVASYRDIPIKVEPSTTYYLSTKYINGFSALGKSDYILVSNSAENNNTWKAIAHSTTGQGYVDGAITSDEKGYLYLRVAPSNISESAYNDFVNNTQVQLEIGSTPTSYEPYNGTTYPLSLGQNVYGGKVDLVSGKLTITKVFIDLATAEATDASALGRWKYILPDIKIVTSGSVVPDVISEQYKAVNSNSFNYVIGTMYQPVNQTYITVVNGDHANKPQGKLVYPLATPIEVDLTPTQITTLLGENNMWADGEISELTFDYGKLLSVLTADQTEVVGRCLGDVAFDGASTMPFFLEVLDDVD